MMMIIKANQIFLKDPNQQCLPLFNKQLK